MNRGTMRPGLPLLAGLVVVALAGCAPSARAPVTSPPGSAIGDREAPRREAAPPAAAPRQGEGGSPPGLATSGPAMLVADPPPACLAAIEAVAEQASGNRVMLGPAAFASSDELVLTRTIVRGPDGRPLDGRMPMPSAVVLKLSLLQGECRVRQVPAGAGSRPPATPAEPPAALIVTDPVALPACRCRPAAP